MPPARKKKKSAKVVIPPPPPLDPFKLSRKGELDIINIQRGRLTQNDLIELETSILERVQAGARKVIIDFAPLAFIDSFGLSFLVAVAAAMKAVGGQVCFISLHERIQTTVKLSDERELRLSVYDDMEAALESLEVEAGATG